MTQTFTDPATMARARVARDKAARQRFMYVEAVEVGDLTVDDVITAACQSAGKALLRLRLDKLLMAQPGFYPRHARAILASLDSVLADTARLPRGTYRHTVAWLVDPRARGRRIAAWVNIAHAQPSADRGSVPTGFPYAPAIKELV